MALSDNSDGCCFFGPAEQGNHGPLLHGEAGAVFLFGEGIVTELNFYYHR